MENMQYIEIVKLVNIFTKTTNNPVTNRKFMLVSFLCYRLFKVNLLCTYDNMYYMPYNLFVTKINKNADTVKYLQNANITNYKYILEQIELLIKNKNNGFKLFNANLKLTISVNPINGSYNNVFILPAGIDTLEQIDIIKEFIISNKNMYGILNYFNVEYT